MIRQSKGSATPCHACPSIASGDCATPCHACPPIAPDDCVTPCRACPPIASGDCVTPCHACPSIASGDCGTPCHYLFLPKTWRVPQSQSNANLYSPAPLRTPTPNQCSKESINLIRQSKGSATPCHACPPIAPGDCATPCHACPPIAPDDCVTPCRACPPIASGDCVTPCHACPSIASGDCGTPCHYLFLPKTWRVPQSQSKANLYSPAPLRTPTPNQCSKESINLIR